MIKVKICGITNIEDAKDAVLSGADALGFVFYSKSKRCVDKETVKTICKSLPPFISTVGVFVNEDINIVNDLTNYCGLDIIQLHGDETQKDCDKVNKKVIKAIRVKDAGSLDYILTFNENIFLLDSYSKNSYGGNGSTFDWNIAKKINENNQIILSGGLTCENVLEAIREVKPYAVDVSSGVELSPGKKDDFKMKKFIQLVKSSNW